FLAIATLPVNTGQASPLTIVRAEKSYYIIRGIRFFFATPIIFDQWNKLGKQKINFEAGVNLRWSYCDRRIRNWLR
ncbi:hypothetical protein, partial [Cyclobacterium amurskyense]|uniref:hypothetical protein n=1 Tax=Cyclobacterium amurskyense TaxID=320787 RepID=UPI0030DA6C99